MIALETHFAEAKAIRGELARAVAGLADVVGDTTGGVTGVVQNLASLSGKIVDRIEPPGSSHLATRRLVASIPGATAAQRT